ncbi:hypothetical protein QIT48_gp04 [Haloterrigena jeotgali icosahedral virus 1]|uniref:Uncharacterized protein n=2 Tax=root TaxID=1 RepID=A0AAF0PE58_9EURY|nr:hypothetical protein [Natrinema thermotolerans]YP_010772642.1 hypothetical protein QIT48_gp04 [Haloterrigena jeotgali icosahedral virus 1]QCC57407.1 hypothetical protein DVR14_01630 [Natrinema thermotolerans]WMT10388.1 hypothetical protein NP511_22765 [Natrinema thermotolerans]WPH65801.1 hypothetical protein HJIV1_gp10 [Haloterrigena jeotgali icosahedral virus 1]DAC85282.1 TPA_asm: hypothetical protein HJIV1gp4 [Haloterrigena jeotgali icosahedral virus 1]
MKPNQSTLDGERQTSLGSIASTEPVVDGVEQVLVSSSSNSRTSYHRQDPHNEGHPKCGQVLRADRSEWDQKPKEAMRRSSANPCPTCYPDGDPR